MDRDGQLVKAVDGRISEKPAPPGKPVPPAVETPASPGDDDQGVGMYSSTRLGSYFGVSATRMNLILRELGWIEPYVKGWVPTEHGKKVGAEVREARHTGVPYVVWPPSLKENQILIASVRDSIGANQAPAAPPPPQQPSEAKPASKPPSAGDVNSDFRERMPAHFRTTDGHLVRSRAEMLIDNWLYMQNIAHAFERRLPVEEEAYCDFFIPQKKVYIEFWGMESDPRYAARMAVKKAIYQKYNMNLVELNDDDIMNLDDVMPRRLLRFGIDCT